MSLHFVKTAILTSNDGIDFDKEEVVESNEAKQARLAAERANQKSLYEILAEQKQQKQDEYDMNSKLLHAPPPRVLDEEEYRFLSDMEKTRRKLDERKREEEAIELERFRQSLEKKSAQAVKPVIGSSSNISRKPQQNATNNTKLIPSIKVKRKQDAINTGKSDSTQSNDEPAIKKSSTSSSDTLNKEDEKLLSSHKIEEQVDKNEDNPSNLFGAYGSDDDEDN